MTKAPNSIKGDPLPPFDTEHAKGAVLKVGQGRGFVMEIGLGSSGMTRIVITAAHCLEGGLPPAMTFAAEEDKTYRNLLGPLDSEDLLVMAECFFADPVADLAVVGEPDTQVYYEEAEAFQDFIETAMVLPISSRIHGEMPGYLLSLDGQWDPCTLTIRQSSIPSGVLWVKDAHEGISAGMSGSPILLDDGTVLGLVCTAGGTSGTFHTEGGPMPLLADALPVWLVQQLTRNRNS